MAARDSGLCLCARDMPFILSASLENFYRQGTPNTGPLGFGVVADAMSAVLAKTGPAILVTHSQGGGAGWLTALRSDHIATEPTDNYGSDQWRGEISLGREFSRLVNKYGGDCTVIHLHELGIRGNTHFMFSDVNSSEIAEIMSEWMAEKGLDE